MSKLKWILGKSARLFFGVFIFGILTSESMLAQTPTPTPTPAPTPRPIIHQSIQRQFEYSMPVSHTSVKDQGKVGFCWSYSALAQIEGEYLNKTGRTVDLSEEYIGFYYIYEQILQNAPAYFKYAVKIKDYGDAKGLKKLWAGVKRFFTNIYRAAVVNYFLRVSEGAPDLRLATDIMNKYGALPESAFSYKIIGSAAETSVEGRVMGFVNNVLRDTTKNLEFRKLDAAGKPTLEPEPKKILEHLARAYTLETASGSQLLKSSEGFSLSGQALTPKTFLSDYLQVEASSFEQTLVSGTNFDDSVVRIERALDSGESVQLGILLFTGYSEAVKGPGILAPENCGTYEHCKPVGGHAILIVNKSYDPETRQLNGFLIKNSWGPHGLNDMGGKSGALGYQVVTLDYLKESFKIYQGKDVAVKSSPFMITMKKGY